MTKNFFLQVVALAVLELFISSRVSARSMGGNVGNGGDVCENRFKIVRDDIRSWLMRDGDAALRFPTGVSRKTYHNLMLRQLEQARISCTDDKVIVGKHEKTCRNFIDSSGDSQIQCNVRRFMQTSEANQYTLVHHEYAGLAGFEVNNSDGSNYVISNQLSAFLEDHVTKKLVVKKVLPPFEPDRDGFRPVPNNEQVLKELDYQLSMSDFSCRRTGREKAQLNNISGNRLLLGGWFKFEFSPKVYLHQNRPVLRYNMNLPEFLVSETQFILSADQKRIEKINIKAHVWVKTSQQDLSTILQPSRPKETTEVFEDNLSCELKCTWQNGDDGHVCR